MKNAVCKKTEKSQVKIARESLKIIMERLESYLDRYAPPIQREVILFITKGRKPAENSDINFLIGEIEKIFNGCEVSLRNQILSVYLDTVLPRLKARYDGDVAIQDVCDELLALTEGKTVQQIKTMIQTIKTKNTTQKKYRKCG